MMKYFKRNPKGLIAAIALIVILLWAIANAEGAEAHEVIVPPDAAFEIRTHCSGRLDCITVLAKVYVELFNVHGSKFRGSHLWDTTNKTFDKLLKVKGCN